MTKDVPATTLNVPAMTMDASSMTMDTSARIMDTAASTKDMASLTLGTTSRTEETVSKTKAASAKTLDAAATTKDGSWMVMETTSMVMEMTRFQQKPAAWFRSWLHFRLKDCRNVVMEDFGVRRQSGSGDGAFGQTGDKLDANDFRVCQSGVALRLPPQSKTTSASKQGENGRTLHSALERLFSFREKACQSGAMF